MKGNYYQTYQRIIGEFSKDSGLKLLLHSCCAPCSTTCLERLVPVIETHVFYYNPNITSKEEYDLRLVEQAKLLEKVYKNEVKLIKGEYDNNKFLTAIKGYEALPERSARCYNCYKLRLEETAKTAKELGYDYFATTLTLSPHKNQEWLNEIGYELQDKYGVKYLPTDFKKEGGYLRSIELSKIYELYRQNYCGCEFSKR